MMAYLVCVGPEREQRNDRGPIPDSPEKNDLLILARLHGEGEEKSSMSNDERDRKQNGKSHGEHSRRDFVGWSATAGLVAATSPASSAALTIAEENVAVKTPDGVCDAAYIHPDTGSYPGVLIWPDAFGLRPAFREMAKRLAAEGYSVLVPNPFYRVAKAPVINDVSSFSFQNPENRAKLAPLMGSVNASGAAE